ncbi:MAG: hypothetical protein WA634_09815 [Silvibacterium sp.]
MATLTTQSIEGHRQEEQLRLDRLKTALERNKLGQFATPPELAHNLTRYVRNLHGDGPVRFLDPAIGTGSFYSALLKTFSSETIHDAAGIEIDPLFAETARNLWAAEGLRIIEGDFTSRSPQPDYNLILTNPPYVRHHHISGSEKERLKTRLARSLQMDISGLAGLYCYFLLLCHDWMEEKALAIWLIPSEFMDVNYGVTLRRYLTERVTLLHIHRFCPTDVQFTDALVSSAVVVFRKSPPPPGHNVRFSFAGPIDAPINEAHVQLQIVAHSSKWTQFPATTTAKEKGRLNLGDIFSIKRGLATGCNEFFILNEQDAKIWDIPQNFLKPILPGPRYVTKEIVETRLDGTPEVCPRLFLLDCSEPEEIIKAKWPRFYEYLVTGYTQKIPEAYLTSRRAPWYSQEQRPPAPFLCTYMGRSRNGKPPFRFIWNKSQATAHNVYLLLYPKGPLLQVLRQSPNLYEQVFEALNRISPAQFLSEGRVYGGGLHKVEPKELAQVSAYTVLDSVDTLLHIEQQTSLFGQ